MKVYCAIAALTAAQALASLCAPAAWATEIERERFAALSRPLHDAYDGYAFSVSPDEQWIATIELGEDGDTLLLLHLDTGLLWEYLFSSSNGEALSRGSWRVGCFSKRSDLLILSLYAVEIFPSMGKIEFELQRDLAAKGTHLGDREIPREFGVVDENGGDSRLRTPDGEILSVDYTEAVEEAKRLDAALPPIPRGMERLARAFAELMTLFPLDANLEEWTTSPDGQYLAGSVRVRNRSLAILIRLDERPLVAQVFDANPLSRMVWSGDSRRLYYYVEMSARFGDC